MLMLIHSTGDWELSSDGIALSFFLLTSFGTTVALLASLLGEFSEQARVNKRVCLFRFSPSESDECAAEGSLLIGEGIEFFFM